MRTFKISCLLLLMLMPLAGCVHDINMVNARRYYDMGLRAESARDWPTAKEAFRRSLINARSGKAPQEVVSMTTYELGRMTGYTCDFAEAEKLLREALQLEQSLPSPNVRNITIRLSELARITFDQGKYQEAVAFYGQAVPALEKQDILTSDPVGYANYLGDYATALDRNGEVDKAKQVRTQADSIRSSNPGKAAKFVPVHYRDVCGRKP